MGKYNIEELLLEDNYYHCENGICIYLRSIPIPRHFNNLNIIYEYLLDNKKVSNEYTAQLNKLQKGIADIYNKNGYLLFSLNNKDNTPSSHILIVGYKNYPKKNDKKVKEDITQLINICESFFKEND
jgi:rRNA pseudouridine-1189 N-methylase Emg1 (Nep1/Mra1 family)